MAARTTDCRKRRILNRSRRRQLFSEGLEPRLLMAVDLHLPGMSGSLVNPMQSALQSTSLGLSSNDSSIDQKTNSNFMNGSYTDTAQFSSEATTFSPTSWIAKFDGVTGSADQQISIIKSKIAAAGLSNVQVTQPMGLPGMVKLETPEGISSDQIKTGLTSVAGFKYVAQDYMVTGLGTFPNDPFFSYEHGLQNTGQADPNIGNGVPGADISATDAWDLTTGSSNVVVGVVDSGIDLFHPDLINNLWVNPGEIANNGIDDDANGYIDDVHGWDFWGQGDPNTTADDDNFPYDELGHGTHVAGTIGAEGNNSQGVTGVAWDVTIMPLRFIGPGNSGWISDAIRAINYATMMRVDKGVNIRITNHSWGGGPYIQALADAIAAHEAAGILMVVAAGNDGKNNDFSPTYPAGYPYDNIISVAATDNSDNLAGFSNYGASSVDLGAPGSSILSTVPGGYNFFFGTSMATPHVSGVAALAWSLSPSATVQQVKAAILGGVDPITSLAGRTVTGGRLNAFNTLQQFGITVQSTSPAVGSVVTTPINDVVVAFNGAVDPASVDAADFSVNGIAATSFVLNDDRRITFSFATSPVSAQGVQTMTMAAASIASQSGSPFGGFSGQFRYDSLLLQVTGTTPDANGVFFLPSPFSYVVSFNEKVDPNSVQPSDLLVTGLPGAVVTQVQVAANGLSATFTIGGVTEEGLLHAVINAGSIADGFGNPGGLFSADYRVDYGTAAYPVPLLPVKPLGSLVYELSKSGLIDPEEDVDNFTITVDPGQTITAVLSTPNGLQGSVQLIASDGKTVASAAASAPGAPALIQTFLVPGQIAIDGSAPQTYTARVLGLNGTTGDYSLRLILNSAIETEVVGGATNDTLATAQNLTSSQIKLSTVASFGGSGNPTRAAVLGELQREFTSPDYYRLNFTNGQTVTVALTALSAGNVDVALLSSTGTVLASGSDFALNLTEALRNFQITTSGTYYLKVTGDALTKYSLLVNAGVGFDTEANNTLATAVPLQGVEVGGRRWSMGHVVAGVSDPFSLRGTPVSGSLIIGNQSLRLGINSDGSFIANDFITGINFDGIEFVAPGVPVATFTIAHDGGTFTNAAPAGGSAIPVTIEDLSVGPRHGARIVGLVGANLQMERVVLFNDGEDFATISTRLTNLSGETMQNVAWLENMDPDQGHFLNLGGNTSNDVEGSKVRASVFTPAYPDGLSIELGANDRRVFTSVAGFLNTNPYDIINFPRDPNGAQEDLAINAAFDFGSLAAGQSTSGRMVMALGKSIASADQAFAVGSNEPDVDMYKFSADANKTIEIETTTPAYGTGEYRNDLDPVIRLYDSSGALVATNDNGAADGRNAKLSYKIPASGTGTYFVEVGASATGKTNGEYVLSVKGANAAPTAAFSVESTSPTSGKALSAPTPITVSFNNAILMTTLQNTDLTVDGVPATSVVATDGDTAVFGVNYAYEFNGHYYVRTATADTWTGAQAQALALGGNLVTVNNQAENDFLQQVFFSGSAAREIYWIGINDAASEGNFVWANGEPVSYTNWESGEPNDFGSIEDYAAINWHYGLGFSSTPGTWNDTPNEGAIRTPYFGIVELTAKPTGSVRAIEGTHNFSLPAGSIKNVLNTSLDPFSGTFVLDFTAPRVVSSSMQQGTTIANAPSLEFTIGFSEAIDQGRVTAFSIPLVDSTTGSTIYPNQFSFDSTGKVLTATFDSSQMPEGMFTLTLNSGDNGFQDLVGLNLDGETNQWPIGPNKSGNGLEGGNFSVSFNIDSPTRSVPLPLSPILPLGSLIYSTPVAAKGFITPGSDFDEWTIALDEGQTLTVQVIPQSPLIGTVEVMAFDGSPIDSTVGTVAGGEILVQSTQQLPAGTYKIRIGSAGGTSGPYSFNLFLNTDLELEDHGGSDNDTTANAQSLDSSFTVLPTGGERGAVLGKLPTFLSTLDEIEPNDSIFNAQNTDAASWTLDNDPDIFNATFQPHLTIAGTGDDTFDVYQFTVSQAFDFGIFDIDHTNGFDAWLDLFDASGNLLSSSDNSGGDPGSENAFSDPLLVYTFLSAGTYFVRIGSYAQQPVPSNASYKLQMSVTNHIVSQPVGSVGDNYSITLAEGQSASIAAKALLGGIVDIHLLDSAGNVVASGSHIGTDGTEHLRFAGGNAGTYYVAVTGSSSVDYSLVVTRGATFEREYNNDFEFAQPLDLASGSASLLGHISADYQQIINAFDSGWYWNDGFHDPNNQNSYTGMPFPGAELRGFWAFDLSTIPTGSRITDARFEVFNPIITDTDSSETVQLHDVTTPIGQLLAGGAGRVDIFNDLGTGATFGTREVFNNEDFSLLQIPLNSDAIAAIKASAGSAFAMGAALSSINPEGPEQALFYNSSQFDTKRIVVNVEEVDIYRVDLTEGQTLQIRSFTPASGPSGEFTNLLNPIVRVYDSRHLLVGETDNDGSLNLQLSLSELPAGTYYIEVDSLNGTSGEYQLSVSTRNIPSTARAASGEMAISSKPATASLSLATATASSDFDVTGDGEVSPRDALLIINRLNSGLSRGVTNDDTRLDVNHDGQISPIDVLLVINQIEISRFSSGNSNASLVIASSPLVAAKTKAPDDAIDVGLPAASISMSPGNFTSTLRGEGEQIDAAAHMELFASVAGEAADELELSIATLAEELVKRRSR